MNNKKWLRYWFYLIGIIPFVFIFNFFVDMYGINNLISIDKFNTKKLMNVKLSTRIKSKGVSQGGFDTLMLGTSRIGVMDPNVVNKYFNVHTYNLSSPASVTSIHKEMFFYALKYNKIKNLIYGVDFMSFNKSMNIADDFNEYHAFQKKIQTQSSIFNLDLYLNLDTLLKSINLVYKNMRNIQKTEPRYVTENGLRDYPNYVLDLKNNTHNFTKNAKIQLNAYFKPTGFYKNYEFSYEYLADFQEIILYCKKHNINVWVYIPPVHDKHLIKLYNSELVKHYELFKKEISKITNYIDFTGYEKITNNTDYYWDTSHLRKEKSSIIIHNILDDTNITALKINQYNVEKHLYDFRSKYRVKEKE